MSKHTGYPKPHYPKINGRWLYPPEWAKLKAREIAKDPYQKYRRRPRLRWSGLPTPYGERKSRLWYIFKGRQVPQLITRGVGHGRVDDV